MGSFYRNGRIWSAQASAYNGLRTLVGVTPEQLWAGAATTRPSPGGAQVSVVSTSIQDDLGIPATTDEWDCVLAGAVDVGDVARLVLNAVNFDTVVEAGMVHATLAAAVADGATLGTFDEYQCTVGGVVAVGDVARLALDGTNYDYTAIFGDTTALVAAGVALLAVADAHYDVTSFGSIVRVKNKVRGVNAGSVASSFTVDPGMDSTFVAVQKVVGRAGQAAWLVTDDAVDTVNCLHATSGATADTVASSFSTDPGVDSTFVAGHTVTGANAVGGTGVQTVQLDYLDGDGVQQSEMVNLNGVVATLSAATDVVELLGVSAILIGSNGSAVGVVSVKDAAGVVVLEEIEVGFCSALSAVTKVPARHRGFVHGATYAASVASQVRISSNCNPATGEVVAGGSFAWHVDQAGVQGHAEAFDAPLGPFAAGSRIWIEAVGAGGRVVTGTLRTYLEPAV